MITCDTPNDYTIETMGEKPITLTREQLIERLQASGVWSPPFLAALLARPPGNSTPAPYGFYRVKVVFDPQFMSPKADWTGAYIESFNLHPDLRKLLERDAISLHCHTKCFAWIKVRAIEPIVPNEYQKWRAK